MQPGIVTSPHCYLRKSPGSSERVNSSGIEDEIFSGWAVRRLEEPETNGWIRIETHYGYEGYVRRSQLRWISWQELQDRQDKERFFRIDIGEADLLSEARVQGLPRELLLKDSIVELLERECSEGWSLVRSASGKEGYVHTRYLMKRQDDDEYLLLHASDGKAYIGKMYFRKKFENLFAGEEAGKGRTTEKQSAEEKLRTSIVESAKKYLGTQYRWGGKSSQGIDCSGLMFMSYMENGILIYRDAKILPEYPVAEIDRGCIRPGDFLFFPGHVGMYLGGDQYIHSTAFEKTACVTINSLNPDDENYREDLALKLTGCGSVFVAARDKTKIPEEGFANRISGHSGKERF